jgi:hypothetical protein
MGFAGQTPPELTARARHHQVPFTERLGRCDLPITGTKKGKRRESGGGRAIMSSKPRLNLNELARADVITALLVETGVDYLLYGRDALKRVRDARRLAQRTGRPCKHVRVLAVRIIVRNSDEMEELAYVVEMVKTYASLN